MTVRKQKNEKAKEVHECVCNGCALCLALLTRIRRQFFRTLRTAPVIGALIQKEVDKSAMDVKRSLLTKVPGEKVITALPPNGTTQKQLLKVPNFACAISIRHKSEILISFVVVVVSFPLFFFLLGLLMV